LPVKPVERAHAETEDERSTQPVTDPYSAIFFHDDAQHWRTRAEQTRKVSEGMRVPEAKAAMLRIADEYERLACRADEKAQTGNR
jgi:hypothetical protein